MIAPIVLEIAVLAWGILLLLFDLFEEEDKTHLAWVGIAGLAVVFVCSFWTLPSNYPVFGGAGFSSFYTNDAQALFFKRFALVTTMLVLLMCVEYRGVVRKSIFGATPEAGLGEFYSLPVLTCAGLMWMASAIDFIFIFISLELVTISFYILVSYMRRNNGSLEAGVKYLILGALSTGFFVYGVTWIFGVTGETNLYAVTAAISRFHEAPAPLLFGMLLVLIGIGFKIAAVPFQIWVPDVYQGAPTPVTAFLSVGSKAAGFIILLRLQQVFMGSPLIGARMNSFILVIAALSLLYGNLAAMPQNNLKRLFAYSSIGHAGYLLMGVAAIGAAGSTFSSSGAVAFYLVGYLLMTLLGFLVMIVVSTHSAGDDIAHFNGLHRRSPLLAFGMLISMLSLAGVPLTVGFAGKFYVFAAAMEQHHYGLVAIGILTVAAGFYYYLKVVRAMYWLEAADKTPIRLHPAVGFTIAGLCAAILILGIYPGPLVKAASGVVTTLSTPPPVLSSN